MPWTVQTVETVLGREVIEELGRILPHENLGRLLSHENICSFAQGAPPPQNLGTVEKIQDITLKTKEKPHRNGSKLELNGNTSKVDLEYDLRLFRSRGGKTILENTIFDYSESVIQQMKALSRATGVNIILGSGRRQWTSEVHTVEKAYNEFYGDLVEGIATPTGHSEVRAGFIGKIDLNWPLSQYEKNILAAAGEVQDQFKCVVSMAAGGNKDSIYEMMRHYNEGGGDEEKVQLLHLNRAFKNAKQLTEYMHLTTSYIGLDAFANDNIYNPLKTDICTISDAECIRCIKKVKQAPMSRLARKEPLQRILLSHNVQYTNQLKSCGGNGYVHIYNSILPALTREENFTIDEIDMLTVENAQQWLRQ